MIALLVARNTFREAARDRALAGLVVAGVAVIAIAQVASPLAMGESRRLTVDLGLTAISLLGLLAVLLVGTSLVAKEVERRTIYNLLSRPITRPTYLVGKWAGLSAALWAMALALGAALWLLVALRGAPGLAGPLVEAVYLAGLEMTVITALAVLFSALSTPVLSALYTLAFFLIGNWSDDLRAFASHAPAGAAAVLHTVANLVPNLPLFNMRTLVAEGHGAPALQLGMATLYAAAYVGCVLYLAAAAFESRDFK